MKIHVAVNDNDVMIGFECDTHEKALRLAKDIVEQMKVGDLHLTLVDPEYGAAAVSKTEH